MIYKTLGYLVVMMGVVHLSAALVAIAYAETDFWVFLSTTLVSLVLGYWLVYLGRKAQGVKSRQLFLLTTLSWLTICVSGCVPLYLLQPEAGLTNAWFESVSGLTTTGSTVYSGLDTMPKSFLYWRCILNWIGGVGIIVMAIAILPALKIGGMRLFKTESSDISEKILPKSANISGAIGMVYLVLTIASAVCYYLGGMNGFDAVTHAMSTIATGGFANYDSSFGVYQDRPQLLWFSSFFMLLAAMPLILFVAMAKGQRRALLNDPQVRFFLLLVGLCTAILTFYQVEYDQRSPFEALTHSMFNVISIITTCGYASEDYTQWGNLAIMMFFYITFAGACSGSTSGGLKIFRIQLSALMLVKQLHLLIHPNAVWTPRYAGRAIDDALLGSILAFCFIYFASIGLVALGLSFYDLDLVTALTGAATAVANVGPGLGNTIGPAGNFASLPAGAKWILSIGMLLGRLEILTVLVLLSPSYWRY